MNHSKQWLIRLVLVAMAFIGFSCGALDGGDPEVYLVRDSEDTFHFQWNEPLVIDRIVLVRAAYSNGTDKRFPRALLSPEAPTEYIYLPDTAVTIEKVESAIPVIKFEYQTYTVTDRHYWSSTQTVNTGWGEWFPKINPILETLDFAVKSDSDGYYVECANMPTLVYKPGEIDYFATSDAGDLPLLTRDDFALVNEPALGDVAVSYILDVDLTVSFALNDSSEDQLLLLKAPSVQSNRVSLSRLFDPPIGSGICTVMILPAEEQRNFTLPAEPYDLANREYSREILTGYPFQPYDVGEPSELTFNY